MTSGESSALAEFKYVSFIYLTSSGDGHEMQKGGRLTRLLDETVYLNCLLRCINRITVGKRMDKTVCHLHIWTQLRLSIPQMSIFTAKTEYFVNWKKFIFIFYMIISIFLKQVCLEISHIIPGRRSRRNLVNPINTSVVMSKSRILLYYIWTYFSTLGN